MTEYQEEIPTAFLPSLQSLNPCVIIGHARSLKDDISKEIPPKLRSDLIFKGLRHLNLSQNTHVNTEEYSVKPLKIRSRAMRAIDSVLKRSA